MNLRRSVAAALLVLMSGCATITTPRDRAPKLWAGLKRGADHVGFRRDGAVSIWYPASAGGEPIRLRDYAVAAGDLAKSLDAQLDTQMFARSDAPAATGGKHAIVMIVTKDGESAADHAVLAEFLASHGYVVAVASPKANIKAIKPTLFLHDVGVDTSRFLSNPADARTRAEKLLEFVAAHS